MTSSFLVPSFRMIKQKLRKLFTPGILGHRVKLQLECDEASFLGHPWTPEGDKQDKKKVTAILAMEPSDDAKNLQSYLGLMSNLTRYSSQLAAITAPFRELKKRKQHFCRVQNMSTHSKLSKRKKSPMIVLTYLDPRADTSIQTDTSQKGAVGCRLTTRRANMLRFKSTY